MFSLFNRNKTEPEMEIEVQDLTDEQVDSMQASVGGRDEYKALMRWAANMKSEKFNDDFNDVVSTGDYDAILANVLNIKKQYDTAMEADPEGTAEAAKEQKPQPPELVRKVWELMAGEENYENNTLTDMQEATKMCLYLIEMEHQHSINQMQGHSEHDTLRMQFEKDISKIRAARHIISDIWVEHLRNTSNNHETNNWCWSPLATLS